MQDRPSLGTAPKWAPASAGVVFGYEWNASNLAGSFPSLFSREGGSPDWVPAFAGKHLAEGVG